MKIGIKRRLWGCSAFCIIAIAQPVYAVNSILNTSCLDPNDPKSCTTTIVPFDNCIKTSDLVQCSSEHSTLTGATSSLTFTKETFEALKNKPGLTKEQIDNFMKVK
jgi:hypothetical protein